MTRLFGLFGRRERREHSGRTSDVPRRRLLVEPLEERRLLAVESWNVVTTLEDAAIVWDDDVVSLREAVHYAPEMAPDGATIQFSEVLKDAPGWPNIVLNGSLNIYSSVTIVGDGQITITGIDSALVNDAYLMLVDVNLEISLYADSNLEAGATCFAGNSSVSYFSGMDGETGETASAVLTALNGTRLTIKNYGDSEEPATYLIHHQDSSGDPLHIYMNGGTITGYQINEGEDEGEIVSDLLTVTKAIDETQLLHSEFTPGKNVAAISFFGGALPVVEDQTTFTVFQGETDVSDPFEWIFTPGTDNTEACGVKVKGDVTLEAGEYTVTVHYQDLAASIDFTVTPDATITLEQTFGPATPQNVDHTEILITSGTSAHFNYDKLHYIISWDESNQSELPDIDKVISITGDKTTQFELNYLGGLEARVAPYCIKVEGYDYETRKYDYFELTITAPTVSLTSICESVSPLTESAELASVALSENFVRQEYLYYTFKLNDEEQEANFSVEEGKLIYSAGDTPLGVGAYTVTVIASDGIDRAQAEYIFTVAAPSIALSPTGGSIAPATQRAVLANVEIAYFPEPDSIDWTVKVEGSEELANGLLSVRFNEIEEVYELVYTNDEVLDISAGEYSVTVTASDGLHSASAEYALVILEPIVDVYSIVSSVAEDSRNMTVAKFVPVNFPDGKITYSIVWGHELPIDDFFELSPVLSDQSVYLSYKPGLAIGEYTITVDAACETPQGIFSVESVYHLTVTEYGTELWIDIDPTSLEIKRSELTAGLELARYSLNNFLTTPELSVFEVTYNGSYTDWAGIKAAGLIDFHVWDGKLYLSREYDHLDLPPSGVYLITIHAHLSGLDRFCEFSLTIYDEKVETEAPNITVDSTGAGQFCVRGSDNEVISQGDGSVLVIENTSDRSPTVMITSVAQQYLDSVYFKSGQLGTITLEKFDNSAFFEEFSYVFGSGVDTGSYFYESFFNPNAVSVTATGFDTDGNEVHSFIMTANNARTVSLNSTVGVQTDYNIISLNNVNVDITANSMMPDEFFVLAEEVRGIDFSKPDAVTFLTNLKIKNLTELLQEQIDTVNLSGSTSDSGVVLNLNNTDYAQSVFYRQNGTLKINTGNVAVITSPRNDVITGGSELTFITSTEEGDGSKDTIIFKGLTGDVSADLSFNFVDLQNNATIVGSGNALNFINMENADNSVVSIQESTGPSVLNIQGDNVSISVGRGSSNIELVGDNGIINSPDKEHDMSVKIVGSNAIVKTGKGNDTIWVTGGRDSLINTGDGDDIIYITGEANNNAISTGAGDDIVLSSSTGGNTIHSNSGNDFIIGGDGWDQIFGGTGCSLLAGGKNSDRIFGGSKRDIIIANITSNMANSSGTIQSFDELKKIRDAVLDLQWWDDETRWKDKTDLMLDDLLAILGDKSVSDSVVDSLSRDSETGLDIFFRNITDGDTISNTLQGDKVYDT